MLKEIIDVWTKEGLLKQSREIILKMFDETRLMYSESALSFKRPRKVAFDINSRDKTVDEMQMDVRKKVLEHLSISPAQDITASLIFIYVVDGLERIGDYCKNVYDLTDIFPKKISEGKYMAALNEIEPMISANFDLTKEAFEESDTKKARQVDTKHLEVKKKVDSLILKIMKDPSLKANEAVSYALYARFLRRIDSHLKNISTAMFNPIQKIGYKPEKGNGG
ncbi:MAG: PhoU domain-containing protein [Candidatus Diapherotrites archaeon]